jgi:hypothetical protein
MRFPLYGWIGALVMIVSEIAVLRHLEPFWSWHTPIAWTGYILFVDGWVFQRRGNSWLTTARAEFVLLAVVSVPLWLVFEWYNTYFIHNWHYINLPADLALRYFGYAWSFATIWPALFETGDLVASFRRINATASVTPDAFVLRRSAFGLASVLSVIFGAALLVWPIAFPSPYLAAPVWLGFIFLLDPVNRRFGAEALTPERTINLAVAGLICGIVWEFWNYWARTKWIYDVPILPNMKIFEMPLPGYGGFPAFALECFTMYITVRLLVWRRRRHPISI